MSYFDVSQIFNGIASNNQSELSPSSDFLNKLENATYNNQTNWFAVNFKTTIGFSFMLLFISVFFINRINRARLKLYECLKNTGSM